MKKKKRHREVDRSYIQKKIALVSHLNSYAYMHGTLKNTNLNYILLQLYNGEQQLIHLSCGCDISTQDKVNTQ